jgi:tetratricopeptide (TPR) repeat protein
MGGFALKLAFSPDEKRLAGVNRDDVKLWDVDSGQEVLTLRGAPPRHRDNGFNPQVAWSPDGSRLAARNWDATISVWDTEDRSQKRGQVKPAWVCGWHLEHVEQALDQGDAFAFRFHWSQVMARMPPDPASQLRLGWLYAQREDWQAAAAAYVQALAREPSQDVRDWCRAACVQWLAGDAEGYQKSCSQLEDRFKDAHLLPDSQTWMIRTLVLSNKPAGDPALLADRTRQMLEQPQEAKGHILSTLGLTHYRAGQYQEAIRMSMSALKEDRSVRPVDYLVLAMSYHELGQADEARKWLDQADSRFQEQMRGAPAHARLYLLLGRSEWWLDYLILRREAETKFKR